VLNNLRIKFIRGEEVKYISHLDLMNVFTRACRRARIPVSHSQGFNPHPNVIFGLPLSVGTTSEAEYADLELSEYVEPSLFTKRLNEELPAGLKIIDTKEKHSKENIMASIAMASYKTAVTIEEEKGIDITHVKIEEFMSKASIFVKKKTKSGLKDVDIKPMIYKLHLMEIEDELCNELFPRDNQDTVIYLDLLLSAGNSVNLKPELLIGALIDALGLKVKLIRVHRTGLFINGGGKLFDPMDVGVLNSL
jgi:radical SAM-linked protein